MKINNKNKNMYKEKLNQVIFESSLDDDQKLMWDLFLKISNEEENEAVLEAVTEEKDNLVYLTKFLRDKIWDMKENNKEAWESILEKEAKYAKLLI